MCPAADPPPVWGRGRGEQNHAGTAGLCPSRFVTAPGNAGLVSRLNQMGVDGSLHTSKNQFSLSVRFPTSQTVSSADSSGSRTPWEPGIDHIFQIT